VAILAALAIPDLIGWRNKASSAGLHGRIFQFPEGQARGHQENGVLHAFTFDATTYKVFIDSNQDLVLDAGERVVASGKWSGYPGLSLDTSRAGW